VLGARTPGDLRGFADGIAALLADSAGTAALDREGRQRIGAKWYWERQAEIRISVSIPGRD
jgi:hypothetical protein